MTVEITATGRAALEYMADRSSRAFTAHDLSEALSVPRPKVQAALAKLRKADLVEYFPDHVGTWAVTRRGYLTVNVREEDVGAVSREERYCMALQTIASLTGLYGDDARKIATLALSK